MASLPPTSSPASQSSQAEVVEHSDGMTTEGRDQEIINLRERRRRREDTVFKVIYELLLENERGMYMLIHRRDDDHYVFYTSEEPGENRPPSHERVVCLSALL
jgi:hypothetical protein